MTVKSLTPALVAQRWVSAGAARMWLKRHAVPAADLGCQISTGSWGAKLEPITADAQAVFDQAEGRPAAEPQAQADAPAAPAKPKRQRPPGFLSVKKAAALAALPPLAQIDAVTGLTVEQGIRAATNLVLQAKGAPVLTDDEAAHMVANRGDQNANQMADGVILARTGKAAAQADQPRQVFLQLGESRAESPDLVNLAKSIARYARIPVFICQAADGAMIQKIDAGTRPMPGNGAAHAPGKRAERGKWQAGMLALLGRPEGASAAELREAAGWNAMPGSAHVRTAADGAGLAWEQFAQDGEKRWRTMPKPA